jgi:uncharacterized membrane-anchored protein YitT (DUF2179 family)
MAFITKEKLFSRDWFRAYSLITVGTFLMAVGFVLFISPYKFAPGGVYGIAIVFHHLFDLPIGAVGLALDIPLTILGFAVLGPRFGIKTIVGFVMLSLWITLLEFTYGYDAFVVDAPLLSGIYGGVLLGIGLGLIFKSKATSGGSDIIALIIVDSAIVLIGWIAFKDPIIPLISWVVIFITGKVIDIVLEGISYQKSLFIISDKHEEIRTKIIDDLNRGGTIINAEGMFMGKPKKIIFVVVNRRELSILQGFIHKIDSEAFMTVSDTSEVLGRGFKSLKHKVEF